MKIKSNALAHEIDSPFYLANKEFCEVFERFIASKKGKVKGTFNAWSYVIFGKIQTNKTWDLKYKRAVYSGTGNIFLSSKSQNLLTLVTWTCPTVKTTNATFFVRKRKFTDALKPLYSKLQEHPKYVIKKKGKHTLFFSSVLKILKPLFESEEIYRITLKNNKLVIELRSELHHFDIFDQLTKIS
ncbi:hypothetical protein [Kordia sp.]|uniref:hypothetical protein n=1 Tax=Kordia sp. TaxID=1965332 RepID=UPI003D2ABEAD